VTDLESVRTRISAILTVAAEPATPAASRSPIK
jgi:hypothetical protein